MTNDELERIKSNIGVISNAITKLVTNIDNLGKSMNEIDDKEQPSEFQEAAILYSRAKNQLVAFLLPVVESLGLTLLDVIQYVQSSPKAKLWVPEGVR